MISNSDFRLESEMKDSVAELQDNVSVPFEQARAMPPSVYTSPTSLNANYRIFFLRIGFALGDQHLL